uniref:Uncharacterized protein n=1 Tax=Arundo donax TaxID=35708 RepID=A0A0A9DMJ0_ARUDO
MSEDLHAEFMWLALVQDVAKSLGTVVAVFVLLLGCKLEHNIMVKANKRVVYRLLRRWIAIFFGLLSAGCGGHDHCTVDATQHAQSISGLLPFGYMFLVTFEDNQGPFLRQMISNLVHHPIDRQLEFNLAQYFVDLLHGFFKGSSYGFLNGSIIRDLILTRITATYC